MQSDDELRDGQGVGDMALAGGAEPSHRGAAAFKQSPSGWTDAVDDRGAAAADAADALRKPVDDPPVFEAAKGPASRTGTGISGAASTPQPPGKLAPLARRTSARNVQDGLVVVGELRSDGGRGGSGRCG